MPRLPFALQLYSVREPLQADPDATLKRVREIGYGHVELAGTADRSAAEFRAALDKAGLTAISAHVPFDRCKSDLDAAVAQCQVLGVSWAVIPWINADDNPSVDDWIARATEMAEFGKAFKAGGIQLCYHNHTQEFAFYDGCTAFETIFQHADPGDLAVELDVGWAHYAGADPVALLKRYAGRTPLIHVKDVKARVDGEAPVPTELGNGATRFAPIFKAAAETGVSWLIVEQDESARDPLESARMNAAYMRVHVF